MDSNSKRTNKLFRAGQFVRALKIYTAELEKDPGSVTLLSNRALVHLKLTNYSEALTDADLALELDPENVKVKYRKGLALIELGRYAEAVDFLTDAVTSVTHGPDRNAIEVILEEAQLFVKQSETGEGYDMKSILALNDPIKRVASFTKRVALREIQGKGRGLIATQDIQPGEVILVSKASFFVTGDEFSNLATANEECDPDLLNAIRNKLLKKLFDKIMNKIKVNPEIRADVFHLWAGDSLKYLEREKGSTADLDADRLKKIIELNGYGHGFSKNLIGEASLVHLILAQLAVDEMHKISAGLWLPVAYINHTCYGGNAFRQGYSDTIVLRAHKLIPKGSEVLMSYAQSASPLSIRESIFTAHGFACQCPLCEIDKREDIFVHETREKLIAKFHRKMENGASLQVLDDIITELELLRKDDPDLNLPVIDVMQPLFTKAGQEGNLTLCSKYAIRIVDLTLTLELVGSAAVTSVIQFIRASQSSAHNKVDEQKLWASRFKKALSMSGESCDNEVMITYVRNGYFSFLGATNTPMEKRYPNFRNYSMVQNIEHALNVKCISDDLKKFMQ